MNNELQFDSILEQIPTITYKDSLNGTRTVISISPKSEAILGYTLAEWNKGKNRLTSLLYSEDRKRVLSILNSKNRKSPFTLEYRLISKGGRPVWFRDVSVLRPGQPNDPDHFFGIMFDITEFKQSEKTLLVHSKRLKTLQEIERAILAVQSPKKTAQTVLKRIREIVPCSRASVTLFDFEAKQFNVLAAIFTGKTKFQPGGSVPLNTIKKEIEVLKIGDVFHVEDINTLKDPSLHIQRLKEEGMRTYIHVPLLSQKILIGSLNLGDNFSNAFTPEHIQIVRELANAMAISIEQARLFKRNNEQSEQLRQISLRLAEIENAERKRLAGELHDQVGQSLTAININLSMIRNSLPSGIEPELAERLDDSITLLEETTSHVRGVMVELRPLVLDDYGLVAALRWYGQQYAQRTGINTHVQGKDLDPPLPDIVEMAFFRITQEALNNVAKHAKADAVTIIVEGKNSNVKITISDDGDGFSPALKKIHGMGILTMKERAIGCGARFSIKSLPGEGTTIILNIKR